MACSLLWKRQGTHIYSRPNDVRRKRWSFVVFVRVLFYETRSNVWVSVTQYRASAPAFQSSKLLCASIFDDCTSVTESVKYNIPSFVKLQCNQHRTENIAHNCKKRRDNHTFVDSSRAISIDFFFFTTSIGATIHYMNTHTVSHRSMVSTCWSRHINTYTEYPNADSSSLAINVHVLCLFNSSTHAFVLRVLHRRPYMSFLSVFSSHRHSHTT